MQTFCIRERRDRPGASARAELATRCGRRLRELRGLGARSQRGSPRATSRIRSVRRARRSAKASASSTRRSTRFGVLARSVRAPRRRPRDRRTRRLGRRELRAPRRGVRRLPLHHRRGQAPRARSGRRSTTSTATRAGSTAKRCAQPAAAHARSRRSCARHASRPRARTRAPCARASPPRRDYVPDYSRQTVLPEVGARGSGEAGGVARCSWSVPAVSACRCCSTSRPLASAASASPMATASRRATCIGSRSTVSPTSASRKRRSRRDELAALNPTRTSRRARRARRRRQRRRGWSPITTSSSSAPTTSAASSGSTMPSCATASRACSASVYQYEGQLQVYRPRAGLALPALSVARRAARRRSSATARRPACSVRCPARSARCRRCRRSRSCSTSADRRPPRRCIVFDLLDVATRRVLTRRNPACRHDARLQANRGRSTRPLELEFEIARRGSARRASTLVDIRERWEREDDPPVAASSGTCR